MLVAGAERRAAAQRIDYITDMTAILGGMFGDGESIERQVSSLDAFTKEEQYNGGAQRT